MKFFALFAFVLASLQTYWALASPPPFNPSDLNTDANAFPSTGTDSRTTMEMTMEQASRMVSSTTEKERVSAAKLLGKYAVRASSLLLIEALDDPSPLVRRAAIVSLVEHYNAGQLIYEPALVERIFAKIADPDVEIRREVTALIPRLVPGLLQSGMEKFEINGRTVFRSRPGSLRPDLFELAQRGFMDPDSIVRQNLLRHHFSLRLQIHPQTMVLLLGDKDPRVLLVALDQVRMYASSPGVLDQIMKIAKHRDSGVRSKVCQTARNLARSFPGFREVLRSMLDDSNPGISSQCAVELARLGERLTDADIEKISRYLLACNGLDGIAEKVYRGLSSLGQDAIEVYRSLTAHSSGRMRSVAWESYLMQTNGWEKPSFWIPALEDRDVKVRESVLNTIRGRTGALEEKELNALISSQYPEVRALAAESLLKADENLVEEAYINLLIDEDGLVRATTLRALAARRISGWLKVHARSLLDSNYAIQRAALDGLLGDPKVGVPALLDFVRAYPAARISSLARQELVRLGYRP